MLELNISTILLQMANFLILAFILYRFLFQPLQNVLKKREDEITRAINEARVTKEEAEETRKRYEEKSNNIDAEIAARKNEARIVIERTRQQMLRDVQTQIQELKNQAEETIEKLREESIQQHKAEIGDMAAQFSKGILTDLMSKEIEEKFEQEFLKKVSELDLPSFLQGTKPEERNSIKVILANKPSTSFAKSLEDLLRTKLSKDLNITYEIDPSLVAGGILRFENKLIDGSLLGQINLLKEKYQETL
jgi:F-type H+-transporting ATPase subunit b